LPRNALGDVAGTRTSTPDEIIARAFASRSAPARHIFVGIQETQALLEGLQRTHPHLVREVVPKLVSPVPTR